jgi:hypothetical protein
MPFVQMFEFTDDEMEAVVDELAAEGAFPNPPNRATAARLHTVWAHRGHPRIAF